jgi:hypothetical protein
MIVHLRGKGLYRLTMDTEIEPTSAIEKSKYLNRMDEAFGTICSLISLELLFHKYFCKSPNEAWTTMEGIFGKQDEMRGHMLEVELLTLDPKTFDNIQDFFTKYKDLLSQLKACGVDLLSQLLFLPFLIFVRCKSDTNVYMLRMTDSLLFLVLYVDDLLIIGCSTSAITAVKRILHDRFLMMDMGPLHFFLGLEIS